MILFQKLTWTTPHILSVDVQPVRDEDYEALATGFHSTAQKVECHLKTLPLIVKFREI